MKILVLTLLLAACGARPRVRHEVIEVYKFQTWPQGLAYEVDPELPEWQKADIQTAMAEWANLTGVETKERSDEADYVRFTPHEFACRSGIGRRGGRQDINLGPYCFLHQIRHEIGHSLGLMHEQSRWDRDQYVVVHLDRVEPGYGYNFESDPGYRPSGAYDLGSVMHYGAYDFAVGDDPVITLLDGTPVPETTGEITALDAEKVRALYR